MRFMPLKSREKVLILRFIHVFKNIAFTAIKRDAKPSSKLGYVKGVPFVNRRHTKGVPFSVKNEI